jgi:hypothetical protein
MKTCSDKNEMIWNILVKVHLRRALCFEKNEKWIQAKNEF